MEKLYFTKLRGAENEPSWYSPCYYDSYMPNGEILANLSNHAFMKLSDILKSKFSSVKFSGRHGRSVQILSPGAKYFPYINDFIFRFDDNADEDFFTVWSSEGIEI